MREDRELSMLVDVMVRDQYSRQLMRKWVYIMPWEIQGCLDAPNPRKFPDIGRESVAHDQMN